MQKNIVFGVNAAMAVTNEKKEQKPAINGPVSESLAIMKRDLEVLREENANFAASMEEMKIQNEDLRKKVEQLLSKKPKKRSKNKTTTKN